MRVKVKDIAKEAGVSATAVSLVLNDRPCRLSESTKEHIRRVAREMNYQNGNGPGWEGCGRVKTIGLILPEEENWFFQRLSAEISRGFFAEGYTVLQCSVGASLDRFCQALESLAGRNIEGLVAVPPYRHGKDARLMKALKSLQESGMPLVLADRAVYSVFCDFVTADHKYGGRIATEHLLQKGHTRIGCILCDQEVYTARKRLEGYKQALAGAGLPFREELVWLGAFDEQTGRAGAKGLRKQGATAIVAGNDRIAIGVYQYAGEQGIRIPEDLSVVGYDDSDVCKFMQPPLTSVGQNVVQLAGQVVEVMLRNLNELAQVRKPENYYFTPYLAERESTQAWN